MYHLMREFAAELRTLAPRQVKDGTWRVSGYYKPGCPPEMRENTVKRAGLPYASRREAGRHSFATEMIVRRGQDAKTIGTWQDPTLLMRRYVHSEDLEGVAERVFGCQFDTKLAHPSKLKVVNSKKAREYNVLSAKMNGARCLEKV